MNPIRHLLVVGAVPDAALAALALKRERPALEVSLLATPGDPDPAGESTTPLVFQRLVGALGVAAGDVHRAARPVWSLGFRMDWGGRGRFVRPFDAALNHREAELYDGYLAGIEGLDAASPGAALISAGRMFPKERSQRVRLMENITGLQLRPRPFAELLLKACRLAGVKVTEGPVASVAAGDDGGVRAIRLEDGRELTADLFVETRADGLLGKEEAGEADGAGLCTHAWTVTRRRGSESIRPFTTIETVDEGWRWRVEHDDSVGFGLAFHEDFLGEDEARSRLLEKVRDPATEPRLHRWRHGHRAQAWSGNVVAVGDAAAFLEPLASVRVPLMIHQLHSLSRVLGEIAEPGPRSRALYQRMSLDVWRELRDFTNAHHRFNTGSDSPYWRWAREHVDLGEHADFIALYQDAGPHPVIENAMPFAPSSLGLSTWFAALVGLGVPVRRRPEVTERDLASWRDRVERNRELARHAATTEVCLDAIRKRADPPKREPIF